MDSPPLSHRRRNALLLVVPLGMLFAPLNSTMIAVALPSLRDEFHVSVQSIAWLITAYLVATASVQPFSGRVGDKLGWRRVYLMGLVVFTVASAVMPFAPSFPALVVLRVIQALGGALLLPNGSAILRAGFPADQLGRALGLSGIVSGLGAVAGPPLGGLLVDLHWSAIFWANVPVALVALVLSIWLLPADRPTDQRARPLDVRGAVLLVVFLVVLVWFVNSLADVGAPLTWVAAVAMVAVTTVFLAWELRAPAAIIAPELLRVRVFALGTAVMLLSNVVMYSAMILIPLYLQEVQGRSGSESGLALFALFIVSMVLGPVTGWAADRYGRRLPALIGATVMPIGVAMLIPIGVDTPLAYVATAMVLVGGGMGIAGLATRTASLEAVGVEVGATAAGVNSLARYLGSIVGTGVMGVVLAGSGTVSLSALHGIYIGVLVLAVLILPIVWALPPGAPRRAAVVPAPAARPAPRVGR